MFDEMRAITFLAPDAPRRRPIGLPDKLPRGTKLLQVVVAGANTSAPTGRRGWTMRSVVAPDVKRSRKVPDGANFAITLPFRVFKGDTLEVIVRLPPTLPGGYTQRGVTIRRFGLFAKNAEDVGGAEYRLEETP